MLLSVPNVAHWQARLTLARGRWPAEDSGTFDSSHLRWFTRDSVAALLADAGLRDVELDAIVPALRNHVALPGRSSAAPSRRGRRSGAALPGLLGYQVIAQRPRAGREPDPAAALCSPRPWACAPSATT